MPGVHSYEGRTRLRQLIAQLYRGVQRAQEPDLDEHWNGQRVRKCLHNLEHERPIDVI